MSIHRFLLTFLVVSIVLIAASTRAAVASANPQTVEEWTVMLNVGTAEKPEALPVHLEFEPGKVTTDGKVSGVIVNGIERIRDLAINATADTITVELDHYASVLTFSRTNGEGVWTKRRGKDNLASVPCRARQRIEPQWDDPSNFLGRWAVDFSDNDDTAVGIFEKAPDTYQVYGTFLTTTGDYRFLAGGVKNGELRLSCFDGGHAFLFRIRHNSQGSLEGVFHSGNWYQDTWTAFRSDDIQLPDAFQQTVWKESVQLADLKFPDLNGNTVSLADDRFSGKCRIIEVFGSWCPNCHDAGEYLTELQQKYSDRGLSIVGLAFELTGDFETDVQQVRTFIDRNQATYPILIGGTSDKTVATGQLQALDRVRSYPTMIFLDQANRVRAIYTGFSGPATGEAHARLRRQFEKLIEDMLQE